MQTRQRPPDFKTGGFCFWLGGWVEAFARLRKSRAGVRIGRDPEKGERQNFDNGIMECGNTFGELLTQLEEKRPLAEIGTL